MTLKVDLGGKVAFVTGASSGLGLHFAQVLAQAGAAVVAAARRYDAVSALAGEIVTRGGRSVAVRLDVRDVNAVREAVDEAEQALGPIDILVNNSGIASSAPLLEETEKGWDSVVDTNLKGAFLVATEVARRMRAHERPGSIINIASILGLRQAASVGVYAASKAALVQLTKTMALEFARYGIRVNALAPGYIETDINRTFWATGPGMAMLKRIPQRRLGREGDLDGPLLLLASDASSYMTGAVIVVDGGHLVSTL